MWQNLQLLGRAAAFPAALATIVLGVQLRTEVIALAAPAPVVMQQQPLDLANARASFAEAHGISGRMTIASR